MTPDRILHDLGNGLCGAEEDLRRIEKGAEMNANAWAALERMKKRIARLEALRRRIEKETCMNKIKGLLERWGVNHTAFNAAVVIACLAVILAALNAGIGTEGQGFFTAVTGIALNIGIFLAVVFSLQFFLGGVGLNVVGVVFQHPVAAAIYCGALMLSLSTLIKG